GRPHRLDGLPGEAGRGFQRPGFGHDLVDRGGRRHGTGRRRSHGSRRVLAGPAPAAYPPQPAGHAPLQSFGVFVTLGAAPERPFPSRMAGTPPKRTTNMSRPPTDWLELPCVPAVWP